MFCRASSTGIIHDLLLYQGQTTFFNVNISPEEQKVGLGGKVVSVLCKSIALPRLSVVFCDNFFTSFPLFYHLNSTVGLKCIGTVKSNRTGGAPLPTDKELMARGRGAFDYASTDDLIAVKWYDNKCVTMLSSACGISPTSTVQRWSKADQDKVSVPCPSLVKAYNAHMGGIDLSDMLIHLYKTPVKARRWHYPLFGYILDLSIANSWLVYKRDCVLLSQKPIDTDGKSG